MSYDLVIEGRFADPVNEVFRGFIGISGGRIEYITEKPISGKVKIALSDSEVVFPGFIDTHVHFREPGWEHKGDMASESKAAALGGVTTAMEMPNTFFQTTSRDRVLEKMMLARKKAVIDLLFYGGVGPGNIYALESMADLVPAFKLFMCESTGNLRLDSTEEVEEAFRAVGEIGKPLAVHCEDQAMNQEAGKRHSFEDHGNLAHALSRPVESEAKAIRDALGLADRHGVRLSVCHVSTMKGMLAVKANNRARAEASMHHSLLNHGDMERLGALGKMNPPLRRSIDQEFMLKSILNGDVNFVGTDHAPHALDEKQAGFSEAPSGVPAVEHYGLFAALLLDKGMGTKELARVTSHNAAEFFGFSDKARIEEGYLADLVVLDTGKTFRVGPPYQAKCGWSPFEGFRFPGRVNCTIKSGKVIVENGKLRV